MPKHKSEDYKISAVMIIDNGQLSKTELEYLIPITL